MGEVLLLLLNGVFIAHLIVSSRRLPERIATHFQFGGQADGWLGRRTYLVVMALVGPGLSILWPLISLALRNTPADFMGRRLVWVGCLLLGFVFGAHCHTVQANRRVPPELPMKHFWALFGMFQIGPVLWLLGLAMAK